MSTISDPERQAAARAALPASADLGCEALLGLLHDAYSGIARLLKVPLELLALADNLLAYPFDLAERYLNEALALADFLKFDFSSAGGLLDALNTLMDCPLVADSALGGQVAEAIDMITELGKLPSETVGALQNAVRGRVRGALDKVKETPAGALSQINDVYDDLLERAGVNDKLRALRNLEACLHNACAGYDGLAAALPGSSEEVLAKVRGTLDDAGNVVTDVVGKAENVSEAAKQGYVAVRNKAAEATAKAGQILIGGGA